MRSLGGAEREAIDRLISCFKLFSHSYKGSICVLLSEMKSIWALNKVYHYSRKPSFSQSVGFAWLIYNLGK